jgi:hypothetical protein
MPNRSYRRWLLTSPRRDLSSFESLTIELHRAWTKALKATGPGASRLSRSALNPATRSPRERGGGEWLRRFSTPRAAVGTTSPLHGNR